MGCTLISAVALAAATDGFSTLLGASTGEVFGGALNGAPATVTRLFACPSAPPAALAALRRRLRAKLALLSALQNPRLVRLLHVCEDTGDATRPFALVCELLAGGSLRDWEAAAVGGGACGAGGAGGAGGAAGLGASAAAAASAATLPFSGMGVTRVVELMRAGTGRAEVAEVGLGALVELTGGWGSLEDRDEKMRWRGGDLVARVRECTGCGCAKVLVAALKAHGTSAAGVAEMGCWAVANICAPGASLAALLVAGAAAAVVAVLRAHVGVAGVAEWGLRALASVACSDCGRDASVAAGAVPAALVSLQAHVGVAGVAEWGLELLVSIAARGSECSFFVAAHGAVPQVVAALRAHVGEAGVARIGCRALAIFAASDCGRAACVAAGAVPALVASLQAHAGGAGVALHGCWALSIIACSHPGRDASVAAGALPAVLAALQAHAGAPDVALHGAWALLNIGISPSHRAAIVAAGAVPTLTTLSSTHSGAVKAKALEALAILTHKCESCSCAC
jgi:hypothetical protein